MSANKENNRAPPSPIAKSTVQAPIVKPTVQAPIVKPTVQAPIVKPTVQKEPSYSSFNPGNQEKFFGSSETTSGKVTQILNKLGKRIKNTPLKFQDQSSLLKAASHAISSIRSEKMSCEEDQTMKELFRHLQFKPDQKGLEQTLSLIFENSQQINLSQQQLRISRQDVSGQSSLKQVELLQMYEKMNAQLNLLNSLIVCLEHKLNFQDQQVVKKELKEFADKVKELGQHAKSIQKNEKEKCGKTIESQLKMLLQESRISMQSIKSSSGYNNFQQYNSNIILAEQPKKQPYQITQQSTHLQSGESSSLKIQQNKDKIDSLILKLQDINESYKKIGQSSYETTSITGFKDSMEVRKQNFMKLLQQ